MYWKNWPPFMKRLDLLGMHGALWVLNGKTLLHYGFEQRQHSPSPLTLTYHLLKFASPQSLKIGKTGWMQNWWGLMHSPPAESFRKVFTNYLKGLPLTTMETGGTVMTEIWCCPGKMGILGLLLCLYWQLEYSGAGLYWEGNVKHVESIFNAILTSNM